MSDFTRADEHDDEKGDGSKCWSFTSPLRLDQLDFELSEALSSDEQNGLTAEGSASEATIETPALVWVTTVVDVDIFETVAEAHAPDPDWRKPLPDGQTITTDSLIQKAGDGTDLTDAEMQAAVRYLLLESVQSEE